MIRHTLLLKFNSCAASMERDAILQSLIALCDRVGAVNSLACGPDVDPRSRADGFTHAFSVVFGTEEARQAFRALPDYAEALAGMAQVAETMPLAD
ncbi:Dabb family protein [Methylobacterium amylolyticum]|uniref:Dabb family protein n=1 Tax=Methylobacterium sp. NEAU 140 TaxID=3064945 RepID=UPI0035207807